MMEEKEYETDELEIIMHDSDPAIIQCNNCDCFVDTDIYTVCPFCGNKVS